MPGLSELSNAVLEFIGSFEGDAPKEAIIMQFGDEINGVLDELMQQNLVNRRWTDGDGTRTVDMGLPFPIMLGPSGDYYLEDDGKIVLAELRIARENESRREIKEENRLKSEHKHNWRVQIVAAIIGEIVAFLLGLLAGYFAFSPK